MNLREAVSAYWAKCWSARIHRNLAVWECIEKRSGLLSHCDATARLLLTASRVVAAMSDRPARTVKNVSIML